MDSFGTAHVLSKAIQKIGAYDLVLCGRQAADWGAGQVGSILAEILNIPVVTLACDIQAVDKTLRVKRILSDGFEVVEAPMPSVVTVSSEISLPRLPAGMRLMMARKKVVPIWKAQDIGAEASAVFDLIKAAQEGNFPVGNLFGAAGYAPFHDLDSAVPADVKAEMEKINAGLLDGSIKTNVPPVKPE